MIRDVGGQHLFYGGGGDIDHADGVIFLQGDIGLAIGGRNILRLEVERRLVVVVFWAEDANGRGKFCIRAVESAEIGGANIGNRGRRDTIRQGNHGYGAFLGLLRIRCRRR